MALDPNNRWIRLSTLTPWDDLRKRMGVANSDKVTQKIIQFARGQELKEKGKGQKREQNYMYKNNKHQCDHRIVSIHQPHMHPIVRGKVKSKVEFGSKIGVSLNCGYARINKLSWDAYNESNDVEAQVEAYKEIHDHYPEILLVDKIYLTRKNREWLKSKGIQITNKPLGRPKKESSYEKSKKKKLKNKRNQIEEKF